MSVTDRKPTGVLRAVLRAPIWLYRWGFGRLFGHRLVFIAHRGRRSGARREVVVEVVRYAPTVPELVVAAAWGANPDWYLNLRAAPAIELRVGGVRWERPRHDFPDAAETLAVLRAYQRAHPKAWKRIAPRLGFPVDIAEARHTAIDGVRAVRFTPR